MNYIFGVLAIVLGAILVIKSEWFYKISAPLIGLNSIWEQAGARV